MKKLKKIMALATATVLTVTPMTAFGGVIEESKENTITNGGGLEINDAKDPDYDKIVLPTISDKTFDFTLDPQKLLHQYDPDNYSDSDSLFFNAIDEKAELTLKDDTDTDGKLYTVKYTAESDLTAFKAAFTMDGSSGAVTYNSEDYYLWVPDTSDTEGHGKYLKIEQSNISKYFDVEDTGTGSSHVKGDVKLKNGGLEETANDKQIYKIGYDEIATPALAAEYVKAGTAASVTALTEDLYYNDDNDGFKKVELSNLTYKEATNSYKGQSQEFKIVNKSTKDIDVNVTLTVTNADALTFSDDKTFADSGNDAAPALVYLAVSDSSNAETPITTVSEDDGTATVTKTYKIDKAANQPITYMTDDTNPLTGGHIYKKYEYSGTTYNSETLSIVGKANDKTDDAVKAAWDAYGEKLSSYVEGDTGVANIKPGLDVVYQITEHQDEAAPTFTASTTEVGVINYTKGAGDDALGSITSIKMTSSKGTFDGYNAFGSYWKKATDTGSKITLPSAFMAYFTTPTSQAEINYTTVGGDAKKVTVNVKCK